MWLYVLREAVNETSLDVGSVMQAETHFWAEVHTEVTSQSFFNWLRFFFHLDRYKGSVELEQPSDNLNQNKFWSRYPINTAEEFWIKPFFLLSPINTTSVDIIYT